MNHTPPTKRWLPASLARRFALAAAGLAMAALLITSLASWWLISEQHDHAASTLVERARTSRAEAVGSDLRELAERMTEIAGSTILATGLVDSAGRETYLAPFLGSIRQVNGIPVRVLFTDFEGTEIAGNADAHFSEEQRAWLRTKLLRGKPAADLFESPQGMELVAFEPMTYRRTTSPEGALLYKVRLSDIDTGDAMRLEWGATPRSAASTAVPVPAIYQELQLRLRGDDAAGGRTGTLPDLPYLHIVLITLLFFGLLVLAGERLARLLTADLKGLERFTRALVAGNLNTERAPAGDSTEVAALAHAVNDMLDRLRAQQETLLREQDKLTEMTHALQAADRRKDDFLAMLGHELRNPLAPISAGSQLLRKLPGTDPRVVRTSELIARQVAHMTKLVDDLLDVSRVTRGLVRLDQTVVDIADIVTASVEQLRPLVEQHRHTLEVEHAVGPVFVLGDRQRLVQVLGNLLSNAVKYTRDGGRIAMRASATDTHVQVVVEDNGTGISADLLPHVFDLFTQGSRTSERAQGGLGLGLALVKNLVDLHGGEVHASSGGEGRGSRLVVRLPRVAAPAQLPSPDDAAERKPARPLSIMVVDDNVDAALTVAHWLRLEGHTVQVAHDGTSALELAVDRVDAYILDIGLPGMDGWELARRLRLRAEGRRAMLIALTGYGRHTDMQQSIEAGFDHHVVKPVNPQLLLSLLELVPATEETR